MKIITSVISIIILASASSKSTWRQEIFGYSLRWQDSWNKISEGQKEEVVIIARSYDKNKPDRLIGEVSGTRLSGTIEVESGGMLKSPEMSPGVIELLDSETIKTKSGVKAICVTLKLNVSMEPFQSPTVFHSVYLPGKNHGCVTFKLRCSKKDYQRLKGEFMSVILDI